MLTLAAKPCLRAFLEEAALPAGVTGPCEWAPLMRAWLARLAFLMAASRSGDSMDVILDITILSDLRIQDGLVAINGAPLK